MADNSSVSTEIAVANNPKKILGAQENRRGAIFYNDPLVSAGGGDTVLLLLGDQLPTTDRFSVRLFPGDLYELPVVISEDGRAHVYNGPVWSLWLTANGGSVLRTTVIT